MRNICFCFDNKINSQLQTVLITASGPQASNALVHRERYTQGSRQNRCVSSQEALALRAKWGSTGGPVSFRARPFSAFCCFGVRALAHTRRPFCSEREGYPPEPYLLTSFWCVVFTSHSRAGVFASFFWLRTYKLPTQNCLRRGIQLYN